MISLNPGYFTEHDLQHAGFKSIGRNVQIAKNTTIVGLENIALGDNIRIDGFSTIVASGEGWLEIGSFVHISGYCYLSAGDGIRMEDFSGLSQGVKIYTRTDDYSGEYLTNPTVPEKYTGTTCGSVILEKHVIVGSGCVILPRVTIGEGSSIGALSLVTKKLDAWGVYSGIPAKKLKNRSKKLLQLEAELMQS
jgi:galactoside O-acetyltransferase